MSGISIITWGGPRAFARLQPQRETKPIGVHAALGHGNALVAPGRLVRAQVFLECGGDGWIILGDNVIG